MTQLQLPAWFVKTKKIYSTNCIQIYGETLTKKLGLEYPEFEELRNKVRTLGYKNLYEYQKNRPANWPRNPDIFYKDKGWISWPDFLGKRIIEYLSFEQCRKEVIELGIKGQAEYQKRRKPNWPSNPNVYYAKKWKGYNHFLNKKVPKYLDYKECRKAVQSANITTMKMYIKKRKANWPKDPISTYASDWTSCYNFFGKKKRKLPSFSALKKEVAKCKFNCKEAYLKNRKENWPATPDRIYSKQFKGWCDFLSKPDRFPPFSQIRKQVRACKFKSLLEYRKKRKSNWPARPELIYKGKGWTDWYDFLGIPKKQFPSFEECIKQVRKFKFKSRTEYDKVRERKNWPAAPYEVYGKKFKNWFFFLGKEN